MRAGGNNAMLLEALWSHWKQREGWHWCWHPCLSWHLGNWELWQTPVSWQRTLQHLTLSRLDVYDEKSCESHSSKYWALSRCSWEIVLKAGTHLPLLHVMVTHGETGRREPCVCRRDVNMYLASLPLIMTPLYLARLPPEGNQLEHLEQLSFDHECW